MIKNNYKVKSSKPANSVWKCSIRMNSWVPPCSAGFPRHESDHWRLNKTYMRLGHFQGTSTWKCPSSSTSAPQQPWETVLPATSKHRWATATRLYTQITNSSLSIHFSRFPGKTHKTIQTMKFNTISPEPPSQCRATVSTDQSWTLQSCSQHKCNSFCNLCWGCLFTAEVLRAEHCH